MSNNEDYTVITKDNINDMEHFIGLFVIFSTLKNYYTQNALLYNDVPNTYVAFVNKKTVTGISLNILLHPNTIGGFHIVSKQKLENDKLLVKPMKKYEITELFNRRDKILNFSPQTDFNGNLITNLAYHAVARGIDVYYPDRLYKYKYVDEKEGF